MEGTRRNVAANVAGRVWSIVSVYLFLPVFLRLLGTEAYGIVGFFMALQGVVIVADLGLTATMSREMARLGGPDQQGERRDLARSLELVYGGIAGLVAVAFVAVAPAIADRWLQARTLRTRELVEALQLMGVAFAVQLPAGLYFGGLLGLERQVRANALQIGWGTLRYGGCALALWLIAPTLRVFFISLTIANIIYVVAARTAYWRALGSGAGSRFRPELVRSRWRYSTGMAAMALLSTLLSQLDKLIVSKLLPLDAFAHYSLASALGQAPVIAAGSIAGAAFPRLTALAAAGPSQRLREFYHAGCQLVTVAAVPLGLTLAAFAPEVLGFWTRSPETVATAGTAARLLLLGSTALALQLIPYHLALAFGWVGLNLRLAMISLLVMAPGLWWLVSHLGLSGAGWAWLALNVATTPVLIVLLHRRVLPGATGRWLVADFGRPALAALAVVVAARWVFPRADSLNRSILLGVVTGVASLVVALAVSPAARAWIRAGRSEQPAL